MLQVSLSGTEYLRARVFHVLCVVQVGDGEVDSKRHQERDCSCGGRRVNEPSPESGLGWGGREGSKDTP